MEIHGGQVAVLISRKELLIFNRNINMVRIATILESMLYAEEF